MKSRSMLIHVLCSYYLLWSNKPQHKGFLTHCTCLPFIYSSVLQIYSMFLVDHLLNLVKKAITDNLFLYIFLQAFYMIFTKKKKVKISLCSNDIHMSEEGVQRPLPTSLFFHCLKISMLLDSRR